MELKKIEYADVRNQMRDGDILMFRGSGIISNIIKWKTGSDYSHCGIVSWWNGRLMVLEAVGIGVVVNPISYELEHYEGTFDYYRPNVEIDDAQRAEMLSFAQLQLGKEYATKDLIKFFLKLVFNKPLITDDTVQRVSSYFCSQYVGAIYAKVGFDLQLNLGNIHTTPAQIAESPLMDYVGTLKDK